MNTTQIVLLLAIVIVIIVLFRLRKKDKPVRNRAKLGIKKVYPNYAAPSPFCDDPSFARPLKEDREANHAFRTLRMQYDTIIKRHNRISKRITHTYNAVREIGDYNGSEMQEIIDLCRRDIQDAPALVEYAKKWAAMQGSKTVYYPTYESFRRLAGIYEKQGKYEEAIAVCDQAVKLGLDNYDPKVSLAKRRKRLTELAEKKERQEEHERILNEKPAEQTKSKSEPVVNTLREELQAYEIIRSMAIELNLQDHITYKDTKSYFAVQMDGNSRAWICRLYLGNETRRVSFRPEEGKSEESVGLQKIEDLYQYREKLLSIMKALAGKDS